MSTSQPAIAECQPAQQDIQPPLKEGKFQAKQLALTYPQCPLPKETAAELIKAALGDKIIQKLIVSQEKHKDGNHHLHAYVSLKKQYICRGEHTTLILEGHKPNVQPVKDKFKWISYLKKEDKDPYQEGIDAS